MTIRIVHPLAEVDTDISAGAVPEGTRDGCVSIHP
jgi:hypothetical protein